MSENNLALNLSKTSIQLLKKGSKKSWYVLGSVDPSSKNLEKDLFLLKKLAAALSSKRPIVDILLPRELVLSQTVVIEDDFSIEHCKKVTAERCGLNENEILIAIGDSHTKSTVPVAAISANSITETRNFVKRAGFRPERYIASSKISGFKKSPVFFNDNSSKRYIDIENKALTQLLTLTSILLIAGFLISLTAKFFEYRYKNKPHNFLAESRNFYNNKNNLKDALELLNAAKKIPDKQSNITILETSTPIFTFTPDEHKNKTPRLNPINKFSAERQISANLKTINIENVYPKKRMLPVLIPGEETKLTEFKEIAKSRYEGLLHFFGSHQKQSRGMLPKIDEDFINFSDMKQKSSKKSASFPSSPQRAEAFASPKKERIINHKYKKILIEEIFSDISLTKILITTELRKASTLPVLFNHSEKPQVLIPKMLMGHNFNRNENKTLIRPTKITLKELVSSAVKPIFHNDLKLDQQLAVKLNKQGLRINLLNDEQKKEPLQFALWKGKKPFIKPKIIDSIKVLEEPTKSTGAVTFVVLPPKMPLVVSKLDKVAARSVRNLNVKNNPPSIPMRASIIGNSTLKNLIELNRTNLIGIFGKRTGRIALIRLSSGNMVKVKVGEKFGNGWRVISIDLDKINITNGSRQETLRIPG